jgi:hypothetical protein
MMPGVDRREADVVVVHAWERPFAELVHSLKSRFAHARDTSVWVDIFAVLQWQDEARPDEHKVGGWWVCFSRQGSRVLIGFAFLSF